MTVWHWLFITILVAVLAYCFWKMWKRSEDPDDLVKVRGWLALLVVGLIVLGPMTTFGNFNSEIQSTERAYPQLKQLDAWISYKTWAWGSVIPAIFLSIVSGAFLGKSRNPAAVTFTKVTIWLIGPVLGAILGIVLPLVFLKAETLGAETWIRFSVNIAIAAIWTRYLSISVRVKTRYQYGAYTN